MTSSDTVPLRPAAIPGVVDGSLTVCAEEDRGISFHVAIGAEPGQAGERARIEFILGPEHAAAVREALAGTGTPPIPCRIGILVIR